MCLCILIWNWQIKGNNWHSWREWFVWNLFSAWPLLLGSLDHLHRRTGPDGTRPSPSVQDIVEEIADGKDKKKWRKEMWGEPGYIVWGHPTNLWCSGERAIGTCGGGVLISVTLPLEAADSMIRELSAVTQVSLHGDIIIHQLLVECVHSDFAGKSPIFCAKWHSAVLCTKQEVSDHLSKGEVTETHTVIQSGYIWYLANPVSHRLLTNSAQPKHTQATVLHQHVWGWHLPWQAT